MTKKERNHKFNLDTARQIGRWICEKNQIQISIINHADPDDFTKDTSQLIINGEIQPRRFSSADLVLFLSGMVAALRALPEISEPETDMDGARYHSPVTAQDLEEDREDQASPSPIMNRLFNYQARIAVTGV